MLVLIPFLGLPALALASPHPGPRIVSVDTSVYCGQYDTIDSGIEYSILLDQWGAAGATSGESCAYISNVGTDTISWVTNFTWTGGTGVKSFTDCQLNDGINQQLSAISSMPVSPLLTIIHIRECYQLICDFPCRLLGLGLCQPPMVLSQMLPTICLHPRPPEVPLRTRS